MRTLNRAAIVNGTKQAIYRTSWAQDTRPVTVKAVHCDGLFIDVANDEGYGRRFRWINNRYQADNGAVLCEQ